MKISRCSRCGTFYTNEGNVCANCTSKDNFELSQFKNFMEEKGLEINSLSEVSTQTGISEKNLNHFLNYNGFEGYKKLFN